MELDPMEIIRTKLRGDFAATSGDTFGFFLDLPSLYGVIRNNVFMLTTAATIVGIGIMVFVKQSKLQAEKKEDLMFRLLIIVLIMAAPSLFHWMKSLYDTLLI